MTASRTTAFGSITARPADVFPVPKLQPLDPAPLATTGAGAEGDAWQTPSGATVPGDGTPLGFTEVSSLLTPNSSSAAAANAINLTAAMSVGGSFSITAPGTYFLEMTTARSYVTLLTGSGVILKKAPAYYLPMFINWGALQTPAVYDTNIEFIGLGTLDGNYSENELGMVAGPGAVLGSFLYGCQGNIAMLGVHNFTMAVRNVRNFNSFAVQWFGNNGLFDGVLVDTGADGFHINGPSRGVQINRCVGLSTDDFIALNAWDWRRSGCLVGDIEGVQINNCSFSGSNYGGRMGAGVRLLAGTRASGYGAGTGNVRSVEVNNFVYRPSGGSVTAGNVGVLIAAEYDQLNAEYAGAGVVEGVTFNGGYFQAPNGSTQAIRFSKIGSPSPADGQSDIVARNIRFRGVHIDTSAGTCVDPVQIDSAYNAIRVQALEISGQWTPAQGTGTDQSLVRVTNKQGADSIKIGPITINATTSTGTVAVFSIGQYTGGQASTVDVLEVENLETAPGFQTSRAVGHLNGGVVNKLVGRSWRVVGTGAGDDFQGIRINSATSRVVDMTLENCVFSSVKVIYNVMAASGAMTVQFNNCRILNSTHPILLQGAATVDCSFRGCSLDTPNNIARVANAAAALTLSLHDTTSTGAGAATVTVASGALQLRRTDRVAFSPSVALTPANNDDVNFSGTPAYAGVNVISGTGAGRYVYRGTGTVGWIKVN